MNKTSSTITFPCGRSLTMTYEKGADMALDCVHCNERIAVLGKHDSYEDAVAKAEHFVAHQDACK